MRSVVVSKGRRAVVALSTVALVWAGGCANEPEAAGSGELATFAASGGPIPPVTPAMYYLAELPTEAYGERALARLFAGGSATYVPVGPAAGYPVVVEVLPELDWMMSQLWGGKTFRVVSSETHPNGDPIVRLDNMILRTESGGLLDLFDAYVTRGILDEQIVGTNGRGELVPPPIGSVETFYLSFFEEPVEVDGEPSVLLDYFEDATPGLTLIRRIYDEIREIDVDACRGLFLGRAFIRSCRSLGCGEALSTIADFPEAPLAYQTRYEWTFWTYFLLNFGQPGGQCDLGPALERVEAELVAEGLDVSLPPTPPLE